ncbi:uncharacterized protein F5Z01DRAFT_653735 [Emericellopsis atlantica]|uniref:Uncharacterized protein n=1 Tax=Emericellopsis atlantica TaxID=2614577 RepID=A0A9P7ZMV5_9HYPO|nr:uncharacterized protein F5Z01DRAFT_653735 [Emericellopsis atlantica]KAG9255038.1 hypothetical protein F5Z01DRAFT_653735 [Emericellopsis atlantica]
MPDEKTIVVSDARCACGKGVSLLLVLACGFHETLLNRACKVLVALGMAVKIPAVLRVEVASPSSVYPNDRERARQHVSFLCLCLRAPRSTRTEWGLHEQLLWLRDPTVALRPLPLGSEPRLLGVESRMVASDALRGRAKASWAGGTRQREIGMPCHRSTDLLLQRVNSSSQLRAWTVDTGATLGTSKRSHHNASTSRCCGAGFVPVDSRTVGRRTISS